MIVSDRRITYGSTTVDLDAQTAAINPDSPSSPAAIAAFLKAAQQQTAASLLSSQQSDDATLLANPGAPVAAPLASGGVDGSGGLSLTVDSGKRSLSGYGIFPNGPPGEVLISMDSQQTTPPPDDATGVTLANQPFPWPWVVGGGLLCVGALYVVLGGKS